MLPLLVIGSIAIVGVSSLFDTVFDRIMGPRMDDYRSEIAKLQHVQLLLSETKEGSLLDYALNGQIATLEQLLSGKKVIATEIEPFLPELDGLVSVRSGTSGVSAPASRDFDDLQADWEKPVRLGGGHTPTQADIAPLTSSTTNLSERLKRRPADMPPRPQSFDRKEQLYPNVPNIELKSTIDRLPRRLTNWLGKFG
jgi:hypothetical protein